MELPFDDDSFDAATMGYGLRNVTDKRRALAELRRVLRPGCRVAILVSAVMAVALALCMLDSAGTAVQDIMPVCLIQDFNNAKAQPAVDAFQVRDGHFCTLSLLGICVFAAKYASILDRLPAVNRAWTCWVGLVPGKCGGTCCALEGRWSGV